MNSMNRKKMIRIRKMYQAHYENYGDDIIFLTRKKEMNWNYEKKKHELNFGNPLFVSSVNLDDNYFLGIRINKQNVIPRIEKEINFLKGFNCL